MLVQQRVHECFRVERGQVVRTFTQADELDGNAELLLNSDHDAALCGAVELGQHDTGDVHDIAEDLRLNHTVLAGGRVNDEQNLSDRRFLLDNALDLAELIHQTGLVLQATCGVHEHGVDALLLASLHGIKRDGCGVGAFLLGTHGLHAHAVTPGGQLLGRGRTERIRGAQEQGLTVSDHHAGNLADRGGLTDAIHADDQHHAGVAVATGGLQLAVHVGADNLHELFAEHLLHGGGVARTLNAHTLLQRLHQAGGRLGTEVSEQQGLLNLVPDVLVDAVAGEQSQQALAEHVVGACQAGTQAHQATRGRVGHIKFNSARCRAFGFFRRSAGGLSRLLTQRLQVRGLLGSAQNGEKYTGDNQYTQHNRANYHHRFVHTTSLPVWAVWLVEVTRMPGCRRSRLDTVKFFSRTHGWRLRVGPAAAARHRTISRMNMRNLAKTPPVFDPRTIDPNRVPTGLKVLIAASFMIAVGFGLVAPVLPNYAQNFNATVTMATMVVSALAITRLIFAPSAGQLITRWGERPVYTIGMLIVSVTSFMIAFAWDYWVLLGSRAVAGIGSVMFTVSAMGLLVRLSPAHMRGRISGYYATAFLLGNLLGPVIASALAPFGMRAPFIVYGFSLLAAGLIVWFLMPSQAALEAERDAIMEAAALAEGKGTGVLPSAADSPAGATGKGAKPAASGGAAGKSDLPAMTVRDALKFSNYRSALVSNWAIGWSVFGVQSSIIPLAAAYLATGGDMSNSVAGTLLASLAMATNSFGNALTQTFSGRFSDRFGRRVMAFSGLLLAGSAVTFMGFAPVAWVFVSLTACLGIGAAFMGPSIQAAVSDVIGTRRSGGQVLAVYQMCSDFGMILGPLVAGMIADAWGFVPAFIISGLLLVAAAFTWAPFRKARWPKDIADADYTGR